MSKATLTFNLPEDEDEFRTATHGGDLCMCIWEFRNWLRNKRKYEEVYEIPIEDVEDKLVSLLEEREVLSLI